MPKCKKCSCDFSVWTARHLVAGICNTCANADVELFKTQSFDCKIADVPLNKVDELHRSAVALGTSARNFRDANVQIVDGELRLSAVDAGNTRVEIAKWSATDVTSAAVSPIEYGSQVSAAFFRSLGVGAGIGVLIFVAVMYKVLTGGASFDFGKAALTLAGTLVGGLVIGLLFNFVPTLVQTKKDMVQLAFRIRDGREMAIALTREQRARATEMLRAVGVVVGS